MAGGVRQLTMALPHRAAMEREDFLVSPCNADAVAWLDKWPDWPGHTLVIHGPRGSGKTHLAHVWKALSSAIVVSASSLAGFPFPEEGPRAAVIEDLEALSDEVALFHFINRIRDHGGSLLMTADRPPARLGVNLPDLASRLRAMPAAAIGAPDDTLFAAILVKHFADRQLKVRSDVVDYLVRRAERSFEEAGRIVDAIDRTALASHRPISLSMVREVLLGPS